MPWQQGQSGNPKGFPKGRKPFAQMLRLELLDNEGQGYRDIARKLIACAKKGESWAIKEIIDRMDGKPVSHAEVTGRDGGPLQMERLDLSHLSDYELELLERVFAPLENLETDDDEETRTH